MDKYTVLVFPCGTEVANEIINSLKNHKYFLLKFASSEAKSYCNFRGKKVSYLPYASEDNFEEYIIDFVKKEKIDFIIPAHDDVALYLSYIKKLEAKTIGQEKFINNLVRFKDKTYKYFRDILPIPDIYKREKDIIFPCFVKPKKGQGSKDAFLIESKKDFLFYKHTYSFEDFVIMENLNQEEFTIDCFSDKGKLLYAGGRTREKVSRGISIQSTLVTKKRLVKQFEKFASIISLKLNMSGLWFFQMKQDKEGKLKLLEIGPRVSGTMMLNRGRGVNFVELALFQKLGFKVEVVFNPIDISLARAFIPKYKTNINYKNLYIDFDDTLFLNEKSINSDLIKLIFEAKNENKKVYLITKNKKNNLTQVLHHFGISHIFTKILHLKAKDKKSDYMTKNSLLIDDSFQERKEAIKNNFYAFSNDMIDVLLK